MHGDAGLPHGRSGYDTEKGAGWIIFAALMLALAGVELHRRPARDRRLEVYVFESTFVFSDLNTWG